ncbi:hypothetical protein C8Q79DRAFT_591922 [Trametes meyenii]|nr:hypothetical protein C8Q79DRAFT_591922 [Trametes meyenii]
MVPSPFPIVRLSCCKPLFQPAPPPPPCSDARKMSTTSKRSARACMDCSRRKGAYESSPVGSGSDVLRTWLTDGTTMPQCAVIETRVRRGAGSASSATCAANRAPTPRIGRARPGTCTSPTPEHGPHQRQRTPPPSLPTPPTLVLSPLRSRRAHLGCDWPGHGPCTHCARTPTPCSFDRAVSGAPVLSLASQGARSPRRPLTARPAASASSLPDRPSRTGVVLVLVHGHAGARACTAASAFASTSGPAPAPAPGAQAVVGGGPVKRPAHGACRDAMGRASRGADARAVGSREAGRGLSERQCLWASVCTNSVMFTTCRDDIPASPARGGMLALRPTDPWLRLHI